MITACTQTIDGSPALRQRAEHVLNLHLHPTDGSPFWIERAQSRGLYRGGDRTIDDLAALGTVTIEDLRRRPLMDYVPRALQSAPERLLIAQTGGTTGGGTWTAYRNDEFREAFIDPFVAIASELNFPRRAGWLFVGPTGPHVIGMVVPHLARAFESATPFMVDFDPRWVKKLGEGSFARQRYLQHVIEQSMAIINSQDVSVLFTTPPVLRALAGSMTARQRAGIRAVHYGGLPVSPREMQEFQSELFSNAIHLSGYGNTLFGCALELEITAGREIDYFPHGNRLLLEVVDQSGAPLEVGGTGRVRFWRFDETNMILGLLERDMAELIACPPDAPAGFSLPGLRNPHTPAAAVAPQAVGLY